MQPLLVLTKITTLLIEKKKTQGISKAVINDWCSLIKRQSNKCYEENKEDSCIANASPTPIIFACVFEDSEREKKRLKEKALKLIYFRKSNRKMQNLKTIIK